MARRSAREQARLAPMATWGLTEHATEKLPGVEHSSANTCYLTSRVSHFTFVSLGFPIYNVKHWPRSLL